MEQFLLCDFACSRHLLRVQQKYSHPISFNYLYKNIIILSSISSVTHNYLSTKTLMFCRKSIMHGLCVSVFFFQNNIIE